MKSWSSSTRLRTPFLDDLADESIRRRNGFIGWIIYELTAERFRPIFRIASRVPWNVDYKSSRDYYVSSLDYCTWRWGEKLKDTPQLRFHLLSPARVTMKIALSSEMLPKPRNEFYFKVKFNWYTCIYRFWINYFPFQLLFVRFNLFRDFPKSILSILNTSL